MKNKKVNSKLIMTLLVIPITIFLLIIFGYSFVSATCSGTGGTLTMDGSYCVHTFLTNGTFNITSSINNATILVVAGGGSGATEGFATGLGGGGGAGGLIYDNYSFSLNNYSIVVGVGGARISGSPATGQIGNNGTNSSISIYGNSTLIYEANGGGGGGGGLSDGAGDNGVNGGSGGGANHNGVGGLATPSTQGHDGGNATSVSSTGGGGGSGAVGSNSAGSTGGNGGNGTQININGTAVYYAGGGGGAATSTKGNGGNGGGGNGGVENVIDATNGVNGTGGGGGGGAINSGTRVGGAGGSGIVIIRYLSGGGDTTYPIFSNPLVFPANGSAYSPGATYYFNITIDNTNGTTGIEFNGTNYTITNSSNVFEFNITDLAAGSYNYYWWSYGNGTSHLFNNSATYSYTVNKDTSSCVVLFNATSPQTYPYNFIAYTNCSSAFELKIGEDATSNNTEYSLGVGTYTFSVTRIDNINYTNIYNEKQFKINQANSAVFTYLNNVRNDIAISNGTSIWLNGTLQNGIGAISLYKNGTLINNGTSPLSNYTLFNVANTLWNITTYYAGNNNYSASFETFYVNVSSATITLSPPTDTNGSYVNRSYIIVNLTSDMLGIQNLTIYLTNSTYDIINTTTTLTSPNYQTITVSNDGVYYINGTVCDSMTCINSLTNTITVDTIYPQIDYTIGTQPDGVNISQNFIFVNVTVNETNEANITFSLYDSPTVRECFQESATIPNQTGTDNCAGLNYTGNYNISGTGVSNFQNGYDGNYSSWFGWNDIFGSDTYIYINYTIPKNFNNNSIWTLKYNSSDYINYTIPQDCLQNNTLQLIIRGYNCGGGTDFYQQHYCINSTGNNKLLSAISGICFSSIETSNDLKFYEEAVIWDVIPIINQTTLSAGSRTINWTSLSDGHYWYNVTDTDRVNHQTSTSLRSITLNTHTPNVTLIYPEDNSYKNNATQNFTFSLNDTTGVKNATLTIIDNATNTVVNQTTQTSFSDIFNTIIGIPVFLTDGIYKWFVQTYDSADNSKTSGNSTVTIDTINPQIDYTTGTLPDGTNISQSFVFINVTINETNQANITYYLYNSSKDLINVTVKSNITTYTNVIIPDGLTEWTKAGLNNANNMIYNGTMNVSSLVNIWNYTIGKEIFTNPLVKDGVVYFGGMQGDNSMYAVNATNGSLIWQYLSTNSFAAYPTIADGAIWAGNDNHTMFKLNATDGTVICSFLTGSYIDSSFIVQNGLVYFAAYDGHFYVLNESNCSLKMSYTVDSPAEQFTVINGSYFYGSSNYYVYKLWANNFTPIWNYSIPGGINRIVTGLSYLEDKLFLGTEGGYTLAINATNGSQIWNYSAGNGGPIGIASDDAYYTGNNDGNFYKLNATNGSLIWSSAIAVNFDNPVILADGKGIVQTTYGFSIFNITNGSIIADYHIGGYGTWATIVSGYLYEASGDYKLHVYNFTSNNIVAIANTTTTNDTSMNFTGLGDGIYYYNVTAKDLANNVNTTSLRKITLDNVAPTITIINPSNNSYKSNSTQNFTFNTSDATSGMANITFSLYNSSGTMINQTNVTSFNPFQSLIGIPITLIDGVYSWIAHIADYANNQATTNNTFTMDATPPQIDYTTGTLPNGTYINHNFIFVNVTVNETNEVNITFILENQTAIINTTTLGAGNRSINWTNLPDTYYWYNVTDTDIVNHQTTTTLRSIILDNMVPNVTLISPPNNTYQNSSIQNFTFSLNDTIGINNVTLTVVDNTTNTIINQTTQTSFSDVLNTIVGIPITLIDGTYKWFVQAFDFAGNSKTSGNFTVTIDTVNPTIGYSSPTTPAGGPQNITAIWANMTATNTNLLLISSTLQLVSGNAIPFSDTQTLTPTAIPTDSLFHNWTSLNQGIYILSGYATDKAGNIQYITNRTINVDNAAPVMNYVPPTPNDGDTVPANAFIINITSISPNLVSQTIYYWSNGTVQTQTTTDAVNTLSQTSLLDGNYSFNASSIDALGNVAWLPTRTVIVAVNQQNITFCRELSSQNGYYLVQNDLTSGNTCLNVTASGITINCFGHTITGNYAILANKPSLTLENCILTSPSSDALRIQGNSPASVYAVNDIFTGSPYGIYIAPEGNLYADNISVTSNTYGIYFNNSANSNTLKDVTMSGNTQALNFINTSYNSITGLKITSGGGTYLTTSTDNNFSGCAITPGGVMWTLSDYSVNNVLFSCYYTATESVDGTSQLIRNWPFTGSVVDSAHNKMQGASIGYSAYSATNINVSYKPTPIKYSNCYQESVNETNQSGTDGNCGLSYTGNYLFTGIWQDPNNLIDGNWNTFGFENGCAASAFLYINYSKPINANNLSLWEVKDDVGIINNSINNHCFNQSVLQLRLNSTYAAGCLSGNVYGDCYNGTDWISLFTHNAAGGDVYEEAMIWNITGPTPPAPTILSYGTLGGGMTTNSLGVASSVITEYMNIFGTNYPSSPYYFNASYGKFVPTAASLSINDSTYHQFILGQEIASTSLSRTAMWIILGIIFLIGIAAAIGFFVVRMREGYSVVDIWKYFIILVIWLTIFSIIYYVLAWFIMGSFYPQV